MEGKPIYFGIDLGTTNSAAATFDGDQVTLVRNAHGNTLTPSAVRIDARGNVAVGSRARRFLETDPDNVCTEFKRLMGTEQQMRFAAAKTTRRPEELAAEVLKSLRADARDQLGFEPQVAVITTPALFELPQSTATSEAARLAGFERVELIQEPIASALAAGWNQAESAGSWLVYDLGGGTFDASLLETRDGLLRVVGHDGDNFLGGRDFDSAIVDWVLAELLRTQGVEISRSQTQHSVGLRKLRFAAEEAKIELTRATSATIALPNAFDVDGTAVDVDCELDRATLEQLCVPLVERSIAVCHRLLETFSVDARGLARVVLVGGPTVMPMLRERVRHALASPLAEGLDPMTLVAQGAAVYAATAGLDARPRARVEPGGRKVWLQYPAMTSDLTPHVVGRVLKEGNAPIPFEIKLRRDDDRWESTPARIDAEGAFYCLVELVPHRPNVFHLQGTLADGSPITLDPPVLTIMQGVTIGDPPLSRSIGVALANNWMQVYFERGSPLPAKRRFIHHTVETVPRGATGMILRIPIIQGEYDKAHLCRLVGSLAITGENLPSNLAAGSPIEVTLELDRGGRLTARACIPSMDLVFDHVEHLVIPEATPASLETSRSTLENRLSQVRADAFRRSATTTLARLMNIEKDMRQVGQDINAAVGGDLDAAQRARRTLLEIDALLDDLESEKRWPELDRDAQLRYAWATRWVEEYGAEPEKRLLREMQSPIDKARKEQNVAELHRQLRIVDSLGVSCYYRRPDAWSVRFDELASRVDSCSDLVRAQALVTQGRKAQQQKDEAALRDIVRQLFGLLPADREERELGYESGVR